MTDAGNEPTACRFGNFEFDFRTDVLRNRGQPVRLAPQPTRVLRLLLERVGDLVTRDEIQRRLWADTVVEFDHGINTCVRQIRDVLGESAATPRYLETISRRGYRIRLPADAQPRPAEASPAARSPARHVRAYTLLAAAVLFAVGAVAVLTLALPDSDRLDEGTSVRPARVAVLPFRNITRSAIDDDLADGMLAELITELGYIAPRHLQVIAPTSSLRYRGVERPFADIARELSVGFVLNGTLRRHGDSVSVSVILASAADGSTIDVARLEYPTPDISRLPGDLASRVAPMIVAGVGPSPGSGRRIAPSPAAREAYYRGRFLLQQGRPGATQRLQAAVNADPAFSPALSALARSYFRDGFRDSAEALAGRALAADPRQAEAHLVLADLSLIYDRNWSSAEEHIAAALDAAPGSADVHHARAFLLSVLGRPEEAVAAIGAALELDPVSPLVTGDAGWISFWAGRYDEAVARCEEALVLDPASLTTEVCLLYANIARGQLAEATRHAARVARGRGQPREADRLARLNPEAALREYWIVSLRLLDTVSSTLVDPYTAAVVRAMAGDDQGALAWLERAAEAPSASVLTAAVDPRLARLRSSRKFQALLARIGLPHSGT